MEKLELQRIDQYEIPLPAIREALMNAVVHRDYSLRGSDIKFAIFDDRIEITSPGALPKSIEFEISSQVDLKSEILSLHDFLKKLTILNNGDRHPKNDQAM
jgi:Predicted transcriptional regulator containing an HTH domain and an uncharacterized domain shared with the mammalian protein Schlafen